QELAQRRYEIKRAELSVRKAIHAYFADIESYRVGEALTKATESYDEAREKIRGKLLKMGYYEAPAGERSTLQQGMIEVHPDVMASRNAISAIRDCDLL